MKVLFTLFSLAALGSNVPHSRDLNPTYFHCANFTGPIMTDFVQLQSRADGDFDVLISLEQTTSQPALEKKYVAKGTIGKTYGEVVFTDGKLAIREISGAVNQISRLWLNGRDPIDMDCGGIPPVPPRN